MATVPDLSGNGSNNEDAFGTQATVPSQAKFDSNGNILVSDTGGSTPETPITERVSYSASGQMVLAASATDVFVLAGNAAKTVAITKMTITGYATATGIAAIALYKRSTANTGGTSSAASVVPNDSNDPASTSVCLVYTANPSTGTAIGIPDRRIVQLPAPTAALQGLWERVWGDVQKPIILRGANECLAINLNGTTVVGGNLLISMEWYEY